jgi:hypothetical protein
MTIARSYLLKVQSRLCGGYTMAVLRREFGNPAHTVRSLSKSGSNISMTHTTQFALLKIVIQVPIAI